MELRYRGRVNMYREQRDKKVKRVEVGVKVGISDPYKAGSKNI